MAGKWPAWARYGVRWPGLEGYGGGESSSLLVVVFSFVRCAGVKRAET